MPATNAETIVLDQMLDQWTPSETVVEDDITAAPLRRLAALLDHEVAPWRADTLPPLGHWLFFLPETRQSLLSIDGHPERGRDLPPIAAPRRMWAGSRIEFLGDIVVGEVATRRSIATRVDRKEGRSGTLTFVTLRHEIRQHGACMLVEEQDLVYRDAAPGASPPPPPRAGRQGDVQRSVMIDPCLLFRYSALTFNAHRIHYDRPYAQGVEHYPGLVVHGPLQATLLVDHLLRSRPGARLAGFSFRGERPLFGDAPVTLNLSETSDTIALWTRDTDGTECLTASATLR